MPLRLALILLSAVSLAHGATEGRAASASARQSAIRIPQSANAGVAVLDLGATETGRRATERLAKRLAGAGANGETKLSLLDRDLVRAAARGVGYRGSLNMTLAEARSLGAAIGCDFYVTGDAQTIRRSSSARPVYFESYASVFVVSARTGRLVLWERPAAEADRPEQAEGYLLAALDASAATRYAAGVVDAFEREERERFRPASGVEAEATVDAEAEIGADGEVGRVRIVRWAGFGLDDAVVSTIRQMHFRPAERGGQAVAVRVLLRYNFRRPPPTPK